MISFTIPGRVRGKGRPRFARGATFVRAYTDVKTKSDEAMVKHFASMAMQGRAPLTGPLGLEVVITLNTPPSWSKRKRAEAAFVTGKPDLDNVVKLLGDAMNGIVWGDDSQLCDVRVRRVYNDASQENVSIRVTEWIARKIDQRGKAA